LLTFRGGPPNPTKEIKVSAQRFRKKPVVIEAMQLIDDMNNHLAIADWVTKGGGRVIIPGAAPCLIIDTLEGQMRADIGDWVIRGVKDEFYPCKADVFLLTYEPIAGELP
jgi:hypothetical protein